MGSHFCGGLGCSLGVQDLDPWPVCVFIFVVCTLSAWFERETQRNAVVSLSLSLSRDVFVLSFSLTHLDVHLPKAGKLCHPNSKVGYPGGWSWTWPPKAKTPDLDP